MLQDLECKTWRLVKGFSRYIDNKPNYSLFENRVLVSVSTEVYAISAIMNAYLKTSLHQTHSPFLYHKLERSPLLLLLYKSVILILFRLSFVYE